MKCPFCGEDSTRVIDSRPADDNSSIRRRRECDECGKRFTTYEKVETIPLIIIKKDKIREAYDRSKIESGVILSKLRWTFVPTGGKDSVKGNRQGSLLRSITRRSDQNRKIKYCFLFCDFASACQKSPFGLF